MFLSAAGRTYFGRAKPASALFLAAALLCSCQSAKPAKIYHSNAFPEEIRWTTEEKKQNIALRKLRSTSEASYHMIRLKGSETPHVHRHHDLVVFVIKGSAKFHLGNKQSEVRPGDVLEIPRGIVHWGENLGKSASEVYAVFTPPYDGKDQEPVLNPEE